MGQELIARGQATITHQKDAYSIHQSLKEYIFSCNEAGVVSDTIQLTNQITVTLGGNNFSAFSIGAVNKPAGIASISVNQVLKSLTISVSAETANLADSGTITIPIVIDGITYNESFTWSKAKKGNAGTNGNDAYTLKATRQSYVVSTDKDGRIHTAVTTNTVVGALKGATAITPVIGTLPTVAGISLSKSGTTVTIVFNVGTSLAENGVFDIPVTVDGKNFSVSFSYAKAKMGDTGPAGTDANMLDWVSDWNTNKTQVGTDSVITPKIFAGVKNSNGTLTGVALGRFSLTTRNDSGSIITETIDGIYGFYLGSKTFSINNSGNVEIGRGNQLIRYNASTGKIEFGSEVSLNWTNAINSAKQELNVSIVEAKNVADTLKQQSVSEGWSTKMTYIGSTGIFTGTLSANTVNALQINASQITAGTISADRLDVNALKSQLITAENINALTLKVEKGEIAGWTIDSDAIYRGTKRNAGGNFTSSSSSMTIGTKGIRGFKWRLDSNGQGALASGAISWDGSGNVNFAESVKLNWINEANRALDEAVNFTEEKINNIKIGGNNLLNNSGNWRNSGWNNGFGDNGGGYTIDNSVQYLGKPTLRTLVGAGLNHSWLKLENNVEYTYTAMVLCNENLSGSGNVPLHYHAGKNNFNEGKITILHYDTSLEANVWKRIYITFKLTGDADSFRPFIYRGTNGTTTFWLANIKLEKGNKATDWTPSVSDTDKIIEEARQTGVDAQAVADALNQRALNEGWSTKLTYIGSTGIFTGTLSANTVNALQINASQITAGQIDVNRLNVVALKSELITASNINALTLEVVRGKIGGWSIDADSIFKGTKNNATGGYTSASSYMTIGSAGIRGYKWRLDADGSGAIAGGHIYWNSAGSIYFSSSVQLQFNSYADQKVDEAKELALAMASGKMLYRDPMFYNSKNNITVYNNSQNGTVVHTLITDNEAPNDSKNVLKINFTGGTASPGVGGFYFANPTQAGKIFIARFIAKIPAGYKVYFASNAIGNEGTGKFLSSQEGTGKYAEYICKVNCGLSGTFATTNFFYLERTYAEPEPPVEWRLAYATVIDITSAEKYTTTINSEGIYTGTLNANQINAGKISSSYLDADSIKANIVNTSYINGLACTFVRGTIGSWSINGSSITSSNSGNYFIIRAGMGDSEVGADRGHRGITLYTDDGYCATGEVKIVQMGALADKNTIQTYSSEINYGFRIALKGGKDIFRADKSGAVIAGWNFDGDSIYLGTKVNSSYAYTGTNGITIGTAGIRSKHFRFEMDGAGSIAGGKILWDAYGNVTFANSVKLNWEEGTNSAKELAMAMAFGKQLFRYTEFITSTGAMTSSGMSGYLSYTTVSPVSLAGCPNSSGIALRMYATAHASSNTIGGFFYSSSLARPNAIFIIRMIAQIPIGFTLKITGPSGDINNNSKFLTSDQGTGNWEEYIVKITCPSNANSYPLGYFYLSGTASTLPFSWYVALYNIYDIRSNEKYVTTIDANGIYTGVIKANQLQIDSTVVVGGSTYNGSISVRDASNVTKVTLSRSGITAVGGTIAGWTISSTQISKNTVVLGSDGSITNGNLWKLNKDGSGQLANGNISWTTAGTLTMTGTINASSGTIGGFTIGYGRIGSVASGSGSGGGLALYDDLFRVGSSTSYVLLGDNVLPAIMSGNATGRIINTKSGFYENNYGLIINVYNGYKNYGILSDAPIVAPYCIQNRATEIKFSGIGYTMDFSQCNLFIVYADATYNVTLPDESRVASMFNLSELPYTFSVIFTLVYHWSWGGQINLQNIRNTNGGLGTYSMSKGDCITLMCTRIGNFHYQILNGSF